MWATWRVKANKCNKDKYQISNNWRASFAFWGLPLKDHSWSSIYHLPYFHHCGIGDWSGLGFERGLEQLNCGQYCLEPRERKTKGWLIYFSQASAVEFSKRRSAGFRFVCATQSVRRLLVPGISIGKVSCWQPVTSTTWNIWCETINCSRKKMLLCEM